MEEDEAAIRGMNIGKYREYAYDVYFKSFIILGKIYKEQGEAVIMELILNKFKNGVEYFSCESGLFACKSILDALSPLS